MPERRFPNLEKELSSSRNWIILVDIGAENHVDVILGVVKTILRQQAAKLIYITVNKPAIAISDTLQDKDIAASDVYFIDCVGVGRTRREERTIYVEPTNLTGISLAMNEMMQSIQEEKVILFDSISTLLIYNSGESVAKFSHFIMAKIRNYKVRGVFIVNERDTPPTLYSTLAKFADKVVKLW